MNRNITRLLLLCMLPLLLAACGSSRKSVRSGSSGTITSSVSKKPTGGAPSDGGAAYLADLLKGINDPMTRDLITEAGGWIGTQYLYGGASREGTDCSGLVMSVYRDVCGVKIPRTTRDQVRYCTQVARNQLLPGDLIFFGLSQSVDSVSHVGMYVGNGRMIHASSSRGVIVSAFDSGYWADRYTTGARVDAAPKSYLAMAKPTPPAQPLALPAEQIYRIETTETSPALAASPSSHQPASIPPAPRESTSPASPMSIDLLDLIISAKVDSIIAND